MTNLRDYDRDVFLIEKVRGMERQLADARESLDIAYAKGLVDGRATAQVKVDQLKGELREIDTALDERVNLTHTAAQIVREMRAEIERLQVELGTLKGVLDYPDCWDTAAYPTIESALHEIAACYRCTGCTTPPSVPEGWQLVPVEPTKAMCKAGERVRRYDKHNNDEFMPDIVYASMLAAAPKPENPDD